MMSSLLDELRKQRVELTPEGDHLRYRAPKGVLTPQLREAIMSRKAVLLSLLRKDTSIQQTWLDRAIRVSRKNASGCFLCKWIIEGFDRHGKLVDAHRDWAGGYDFPIDSQLEHLKIETRRNAAD